MSTPENGGMDPGQALAFVAGYPDCWIGPGVERTDSRIEIAYEFGFRDLRDAVNGVRARRDLVSGIYDLLTVNSLEEAEGSGLQPSEYILMLEALHNSFPDEAGKFDHDLEIPVWTSHTAPEVRSTDPWEFRGAVGTFLERAGHLEGAIDVTNDEESRIVLFKTAEGRVTEFDMIACEGVARREMVVRLTPTTCYIMHKVEYAHDSKEYNWEMKVAAKVGQVEGTLLNNGARRVLKTDNTINAVNHMLGSLSRELSDRREAASIDDAL